VERELVEQAQRGDREAFAALVHLTADRLYGIAYRILRESDQAEDALQSALIDLWDDLPSLRDPDRFEAWTYRLIARASYREARRGRRWTAKVRRIVVAPEPSDDGGLDQLVLHDEMERAFRQLTPEHRAVVVLHYFVGLPLTEVADALGVPVGTAGSRLHYAVRGLRAAFDADARRVVAWRHPA
jgi:RNA polymerase sigma-70 factor (ECF subfamily)